MHAIGHMPNRDFILRPIRKERLKNVPTDRSMELTDSIHHTTSAHGQVGHVEGLITVVAIPPSQGEEIMYWYLHEFREIGRIGANQIRGKPIECRLDRRMSRKNIAGSSCPERHPEGLFRPAHVAVCACEHCKSGMPLVEMAHFHI